MSSSLAPAGWYPDPSGDATWRWWDGTAWTVNVSARTATAARPQMIVELPTFPAKGVWYALVGVFGAMTWPRVVELEPIRANLHAPVIAIAVIYGGLFAVMAASCVGAVRRLGTGSLRADLGWQIKPPDLLWGLLAMLAGQIGRILVSAPLAWLGDAKAYTGAVKGLSSRPGVYAVFIVAAIVGAPLFEELLFRGLLLRSLVTRFGPWPAQIGQSLLFGLYHANLGFGWFNVPLCLGNAALGFAFGIIAQRRGHLGAGIVGHAAANALALTISHFVIP